MNEYQKAKARKIVALLTSLQAQVNGHELAKCVAIMSHDEWRTVCFTAGVPVADLEAKAAVLAMLRGRVPQVVGR